MNGNKQKGFTLVELLISLSILVIIEGSMLQLLRSSIENNAVSGSRSKVVSAAQGVIEICKCTSLENIVGSSDNNIDKSVICFYNSNSDKLYETFINCSIIDDGIDSESFSSLENRSNRDFDIIIRAVFSSFDEDMEGITITAWDKKYGEKSMVKLVAIRRKNL